MHVPGCKDLFTPSTGRCGEAIVGRVLSYERRAHTCPAVSRQQAVEIGAININRKIRAMRKPALGRLGSGQRMFREEGEGKVTFIAVMECLVDTGCG